ncbi:MAG: tetratricopeptide repeat protein [Alphaproteobacteria bacterium]
MLADAARCYAAALARAPGDPAALRLAGLLATQLGDGARGAALLAAARGAAGDAAEAEAALGDALHALGRPAEALAAHDRALAVDASRPAAHAGRGAALRALGRLGEAIAAQRQAVGLSPADAGLRFGLGVALQAARANEEAAAAYRDAIAIDPGHVPSLANLALALGALGRNEEALAPAEAALALAPGMAEAHGARASALRATGRAAEALAALDAGLALAPANAAFHVNRANVLRDLGRPAEARDAYDRALALQPGLADARRNRAMLMLLAGEWEEGWREWEWRKRSSEPSGDRFASRPAWSGAEDPAGRRIFLHWEQGFGDTIQFCRYAPLLAARGARVTLSVQEPLLRLAASLAPGIEVVGGARGPAGGFDLHCPLMSLPLAFGTTPGSVPPPAALRAPLELEAAWAARLGPRDGRPRIGLAWSGRPSHANDRNRSMPFAALAPLLGPGARWICVQQEIRQADAAALRADGRVEHFGPELGDFADTAALLAQLDLVVSVDTAVAHLAGTLGLPLWLLLPRDPDWRWLAGREDSPWYPSARLFRQGSAGDWAGVLGQVSTALAARRG